MSPTLKQYLHWIGSALAITGIVFVSFRLSDYSSQLDLSRFNSFAWAIAAGLAIIYGLANILLALSWRIILGYFGANASPRWSVRIYGLTQLAKYIPGNIMHLAGRQAMGQAAGIPGWPLAKAAIWELGLISITGLSFTIFVIPQFLSAVSVPMAAGGFTSLLIIIAMILKNYVSQAIALSFGYYLLFLVISGSIFVGSILLTTNQNPIAPSDWPLFCGAFIVAWLAGLVTPGAPAGVGVRELVLVVLLKGLVSESDLLLSVLLARVVTVAGDMLFFLLASILRCREPNFTQGASENQLR